jgi:hypothetical protein
MITYLYWAAVMALVVGAMAFFAGRLNNVRVALAVAVVILVGGWAAYYFHFQQIFVKRFGGVMSISVPDGQMHIGATWKDDNLWIENYDPDTDTCIFSEYSRGALLEGRVRIKNCKPLLPVGTAPTAGIPPFAAPRAATE